MPPIEESSSRRSLQEVVQHLDRYPIEAFHFIQQGLGHTVEKIHGGLTDPRANRHVSGQDLCEGLRDFALLKWGMMARTVLRYWNINSTMDFGRIVFAMIDFELMQRTEQDTIDDFRDVYDFKTAFESDYRISLEPQVQRASEGRQ
jgi:uncharacterized repeat protein (TIGR04138 family)